jgi:hypothetical protein
MHIKMKIAGAGALALSLALAANVAFARDDSRFGDDDRFEHRLASTTRQEAHDRIEAAREEAKERMHEKREEAREHFAEIADKKKQEMAGSLSEKFDKINTEWTDRFTKKLDHLDEILDRIEGRAADGKGTDATDEAIDDAKDAITAARAAVLEQAGKSYTIDTATLPTTATSTPSGQERIMQGLRKAFQGLHTGLFKDLFALRDGAMKTALQAVHKAAQTLSRGGKHATSTEPVTP